MTALRPSYGDRRQGGREGGMRASLHLAVLLYAALLPSSGGLIRRFPNIPDKFDLPGYHMGCYCFGAVCS